MNIAGCVFNVNISYFSSFKLVLFLIINIVYCFNFFYSLLGLQNTVSLSLINKRKIITTVRQVRKGGVAVKSIQHSLVSNIPAGIARFNLKLFPR